MWIVFKFASATSKHESIFSTSFYVAHANLKTIHRATSKQKETTSDCNCLSKGVFGLPFDQKRPRKDSYNHKSFLLFTRCELLSLKAITFVIRRVVSRRTS